MTKQSTEPGTQAKSSRRSMLFAAGGVSAAAAVVFAAKGAGPIEATAEVAAMPAPDNGGGYHVTDHIKRYYATTLV